MRARAQAVDPVVLRGRRVVLRTLSDNDFEGWSEVRTRCHDWLVPWEPRVAGTALPPEDRRNFAARCALRERERQLGTGFGFGIFLGGRFAGELTLSSIQRGPFQSAFVGYWIDRAEAGKGYVPEAVVACLRFAFGELSLHRVEISIIPRNHASRRVVEKLGVRFEGIAERFLSIDGVWEDHARYAITSEEWARRGAGLCTEWLD
ncbi:MAG TPA: GNAT family protein [Acidimicrobiales bacterium]|nr:GNAT family protein [Acidimicrobiales bacterium]